MTPTQTFVPTWSLGMDSKVPFGPGLSPIFKSLKDQKLSQHSKESPSNYPYLSGGEGTKLPPLLNMIKNSLLTTPVSQGGEVPSFPDSWNSLNPSDSSDEVKTSLSTIWRMKWQPTPIFLPGESHGRRILAGYSPWDRKEPDTNEATSLSLSFLPDFN